MNKNIKNKAYFNNNRMKDSHYWESDGDICLYGEFEDDLMITGYGRGRSAAYFLLKSINTGTKYTMSIAAFAFAVASLKIENNVMTGKFTFKKQGTAYTICPAGYRTESEKRFWKDNDHRADSIKESDNWLDELVELGLQKLDKNED